MTTKTHSKKNIKVQKTAFIKKHKKNVTTKKGNKNSMYSKTLFEKIKRRGNESR